MGLGLAIGMDAMRACQAYPWWRGLLLRWWECAPLPGELIAASPRDENIASVARFRERITELLHGRWVRGRVQVGLPDTAVRVRLLFADTLPADPGERRKYLLWRLADTLEVRPEQSRLAYQVLPSPVPGPRQAVLCAVSAAKVIQQYERALAESRVRHAGLTPSALLLFNLFHRHLAGPPGVPLLFLAANEVSSTTVIVLGGCPIFWRTRRLTGVGEASPREIRPTVQSREGAQAPPCPLGQAPHDARGALALRRAREAPARAESTEAGQAELRPRLRVAPSPSPRPAPSGDWRGEFLRDVSEATAYVADELGVGPPARLLVTGSLADKLHLPGWLTARLGLPVEALDAGRLVRPLARRPNDEGWNRWEVALGASVRS